jgi:hypothetical protein
MMAISNNLLMAILSMDAYNRIYQQQIVVEANQVGTATLLTNIDMPTGYEQASFFAQAYRLENSGATVISYRGTNDTSISLEGDIWNGWGMGLGSPGATQAEMAVQFYNSVVASGVTGATIAMTGHSLGGGLAGFVASLYGNNAVIYDNMPFEGAAGHAQEYSDNYFHSVEGYYDYYNLYHTIYGDADPWAINMAGISGYAVTGELLSASRLLQQTPVNSLNSYSSLGSYDLHSMDLLVILMFASESGHTLWQSAANPVLNALFDTSLASVIGGCPEGAASVDAKLRGAIAYSAIDEGTRVFGDTGIRALFNDADELGLALTGGNVSSTLSASSDAIAKILAQFAGQLAFGKVSMASAPEALSGVLALAMGQQTLTVDFADSLWRLGNSNGQATTNIVGRKELTDAVFSHWTTNDIRTGMTWLWGDNDSSIIDRIVFATTDDPLTTTIPDRETPSEKVTLFAAGGSSDQITGSQYRDSIYGGNGNDNLRGGDGDDLMAGGEGDDRLCGGSGKDYLAGGNGNDTVYYEADQLNLTLKTIASEGAGQAATLELNRGGGDVDRAVGVENVELTSGSDTVAFQGTLNRLGFDVVVNGGAGHDVLDFSGAAGSAYLGPSQIGSGVQAYLGNNSFQGFHGATGLSFNNFETIIGTSRDDVMNLSQMSSAGSGPMLAAGLKVQ